MEWHFTAPFARGFSALANPEDTLARTDTDDMLHITEWHNGEKRWSPFSKKIGRASW